MNRMAVDVCCYPESAEKLSNENLLSDLLTRIIRELKPKAATCRTIPCQELPKPGVSGIILASGFHFTCHTFSADNMIYIDAFGLHSEDDRTNIIQSIMELYDICRMATHSPAFDFPSNFGRHITFTVPYVPAETMIAKINQLVKDIDMHELCPMFTRLSDDGSYDILQPITESHIAAHAKADRVEVDVFSCNPFDDQEIFKIFPERFAVHLIPRGI